MGDVEQEGKEPPLAVGETTSSGNGHLWEHKLQFALASASAMMHIAYALRFSSQ
jgi:hypothetical protein